MSEKKKSTLHAISRKLEIIHSGMLTVTAALDNGGRKYETMEFVPAMESMVGEIYMVMSMVLEIDGTIQ